MKCPKCGRIIDDDSKYCDYCGTKALQANTLKKKTQIVESNTLPQQDESQLQQDYQDYYASKQQTTPQADVSAQKVREDSPSERKWAVVFLINCILVIIIAFGVVSEKIRLRRGGLNGYNPVDTVAMADTTTMANQQIDSSIVEFMTYIKAVADSVAKEQRQKEEEEACGKEKELAESERKAAEEAYKELERIARLKSQGWVDLGLPSGTLWKDKNEPGGFYTYDEAVAKFGSNLPTKNQCEELKNSCRWTWTGDGYIVKGPNGNQIFLPAAGFLLRSGSVSNVGSSGNYWSSTPDGSEDAWDLCFSSICVQMCYYHDRCDGKSVRLVR